jgi:outer membrane protein OmpA-like peptidoglycan-associated protein
MTAREAVQTAEDSRAIAVKRQEADVQTAERQGLVDRETRAVNGQVAAQSETDRVTREAEAARIRAQAEAERVTRENNAQATAASAEADRLKRENDARMVAAASDADRLRIENEARATAAKTEADRLKLDSDSRMAAAGVEADRLKRENDAQRAATQAELDNAAKQKAQLEADKVELRVQLLKQFNVILQTRDTARGLIVNMSDVLFDTAKFTLRPVAREKLAKVAGIVSAHPGLRLDVEGHTDSVGGDDYNQQLSEQRGAAVRDYLLQQGMPVNSVTSKGFGKTQPVATNDTAAGRQTNRRVEIVISGEVIGTEIGKVVTIR